MSKLELASRLDCDEKQVRRLLDPRHVSRLPQLQAALSLLGKQLVIRVRDAAEPEQPRRPFVLVDESATEFPFVAGGFARFD